MPKTNPIQNKNAFFGIIAVLAIVVVVLLYFNLETSANYTSLNNAYLQATSEIGTLNTNSSHLIAQINSTQSNLDVLSAQYNKTDYNLTNPYTEILYNKDVVSIPAETYNYSLGTWNDSKANFNFSFNAPYPGYLVMNYSVSPENDNPVNATFWIYESNEKPYYQGGSIELNSYVTPYTDYAGPSGSTFVIPITNGTNHIIMYSYENQSTAVEFSVKYVGFRTS
jgi:hypothetical protein